MTWLDALVAGLDVYLLASLGPWIALQIVEWLLCKPGRRLVSGGVRLRELRETEQEQVAAWPREPRPGRYREPDRTALEHLAILQATLGEADRLEPGLSDFVSPDLGLVDVLSLRSWGPLFEALAAYRRAHALRRLLDRVDEAHAALREQQQVVQDVPAKVRALLNETRAEVTRLSAVLEAEEDAGTAGLEEMSQRLDATKAEIEQALDALAQANPTEVPLVVFEIDQFLELAGPSVEEMDRQLSQVVAERNRAQNLVTRVESSLRLAEERWEGLKSRGATEPSLVGELPELWTSMATSTSLAKERTLEAYHRVLDEATSLRGRIESYMDRLDALDQVMELSREAVAGDAQVLSQTQTAYDELVREDPLLDPDQTLALIQKATQAYAEAERQRALGSLEGYHAALGASETARRLLAEAHGALASLPEAASEVRELLDALSADALGDWRSRADRLREELQVYPRHWDRGLAGDVGEAISNLDQVEVDLERISPNVRYQRRFRQSELSEAIELLSHGRHSMAKAKELVVGLEGELQRIEELRRDLALAVDELALETMPEMRELSRRMLPELRQRFESLEGRFLRQSAVVRDPARVNYDEAVGEWLPSVRQELGELRSDHENSLRRYSSALGEAVRRIDRAWARLARLSPRDPPTPEEDIDRLAADLDAWRAEAERSSGDPLALREVAGRRVAALEQRIETARGQIGEGRNRLEALNREYGKHAQAMQSLRDAIGQIQSESEWGHIDWNTDDAERAWEEATRFDRASRTAETLTSAGDQLQRAVNAAQKAGQLYARTEHQVNSALSRLDEELYRVVSALERGERRAGQLAERGLPEEAREVEELCGRAERVVEMAKAATTFEDALMHLREAREALARI